MAAPAPGRDELADMEREETTHAQHQARALERGDARSVGHGIEAHARRQLASVERGRRLEHILEAALGPGPLERMLRDLLERTGDAVEADVAHVLFVNDKRDAVVVAAAVGYSRPVRGIAIPAGAGFAGRIMASAKPLQASPPGMMPGVHPVVQQEGIRSYLGVPMFVDGAVSGVLVVGRRDERPFSDDDERLLMVVADRIAVALDRQRLLEQATRLHKSAQAQAKFRSDLLNMASHDLKTPLSAMAIQLQLLEMGEPLDERRQKALRILHRSTNRLRLMLDDMLDLARLEAGSFVLQRVETDVSHVVREACEIFGPKARAAGIRFHERSEEGLLVKADDRRLSQVLANLLSNAVRATPPGGQITIRSAAEGDEAQITVEDTGVGMSREQLDRLFTPFERIADDPSHRGTGLGLYLSRIIVEQHGGTLRIDSPGIGQGTTATIRLPRQRDAGHD